MALGTESHRQNIIRKPRSLAPCRRQRRVQPNFLFVPQHLDPGKAVGISPHRIKYACEISFDAAAAFLKKMRKKRRHFMRAQRPLQRIEQLIPAFLRRWILERTRNEFIPGMQIVSARSSHRTRQHMQQHQGPSGLPSSQIPRRAASPQMRRKAASSARDLARRLDDGLRLHSTLFLRELGRELRVMPLEGLNQSLETWPLAQNPSTSSSSQFVQLFTKAASNRFSPRITIAMASRTAASVPGYVGIQ